MQAAIIDQQAPVVPVNSNARSADRVASTEGATPNATSTSPGPTTKPRPQMTWKSWVTAAVVVALVVLLVTEAIPATSAMILSAMTLYLAQIVTIDELFKGLVNNGVLAIVFMFILVGPLTKLPLMQKLIEVTLAGRTTQPVRPPMVFEDDEPVPTNPLPSAKDSKAAAATVNMDNQPSHRRDSIDPAPPAATSMSPQDFSDNRSILHRRHSSMRRAKTLGGSVIAEPRRVSSIIPETVRRPAPVLWPTFKMVMVSLLTSSFLENTPHVAAFAPMITKYCIDHAIAPSLMLLPMCFAVILGNYGIVGCSSNLVFAGLLEDQGYGTMSFFELAKIGLPQLPVVVLYLVLAPWYLLPRDRGFPGIAQAHLDGLESPALQVRVLESSRLFDLSIPEALNRMPGGRQGIDVESVTRHGVDVPTCPSLDGTPFRIEIGDVLWLRGDCGLVLAACEYCGVELLTANGLRARREAIKWALSTMQREGIEDVVAVAATELGSAGDLSAHHHNQHGGSSDHASVLTNGGSLAIRASLAENLLNRRAPSLHNLYPGTDGPHGGGAALQHDADPEYSVVTPMLGPVAGEAVVASFSLSIVEVVLSARNASIGRTIASQHFQAHYGASVLAVRCSMTGEEADLDNHTWSVGDVALLLAPSTFERAHQAAYEFLSMKTVAGPEQSAEPFVLSYPGWVPFGIPSGMDEKTGKPKRKLVVLPPNYGYVALLVFIAALAAAAATHVPLSALCFGATILIVASGITTTSKALKLIHLDVYALVAFSFPLGYAVDNSGLARVVGQLIVDADIKGFPLLLLVCAVSVILTNVITNKAASQVMYPVVVSIYRAHELDPVPAVYAAAYSVVFALCMPYAMPASLLVFGPGGYRTIDFIKFGVPITIISTLMTAVITTLVYGLDW